MKYEVSRDNLYAEWKVQATDSDGRRRTAIFRGPDADKRAHAYCAWINSQPEEQVQE